MLCVSRPPLMAWPPYPVHLAFSETVAPRSGAPPPTPATWQPRDLGSLPPSAITHESCPLLLTRVAKDGRCRPPARWGTGHCRPCSGGQDASKRRTFCDRWPYSDHYFIILFNYSCLQLILGSLLWICYYYYNFLSIIFRIWFWIFFTYVIPSHKMLTRKAHSRRSPLLEEEKQCK